MSWRPFYLQRQDEKDKHWDKLAYIINVVGGFVECYIKHYSVSKLCAQILSSFSRQPNRLLTPNLCMAILMFKTIFDSLLLSKIWHKPPHSKKGVDLSSYWLFRNFCKVSFILSNNLFLLFSKTNFFNTGIHLISFFWFLKTFSLNWWCVTVMS